MDVEYIKGTNIAYCDGLRFRRDKKTGYYLCVQVKPQKRLHVYMWEKYNGPVPKGYEVHHRDHDKNNNEISNLQLMDKKQHRLLHGEQLSPISRDRLRENMLTTAIPAAAKWHKSEDGRAWHREHYAKVADKLRQTQEFTCEQCGKVFESSNLKSRFCSNACKSQWRRDNDLNKEERICIICGKVFLSDKYKTTKTCSRQCAGKLRWSKRKGQ